MTCRSLMFIPAKSKTLSKLGQFDADAYVIDLEDSIEEQNKTVALLDAFACLKELDSHNYKVYVRLNKERYQEEAEKLSLFTDVGFMLPKFESIDEYAELENVWKTHSVIALIETPLGIVNINGISSCDWVDSLAFGAEDYTASINMENQSRLLAYPKSVLITYGKAYGKTVFDTPSFQLNDMDLLKDEIDSAVSMGFDGKLAIHPKQIPLINQAFLSIDIEWMQRVVDAYEQQGDAVFVYEGRPYEKMHIARFRRIIKENGGTK